MASRNRMLPPAGQKASGKGGRLEDHLQLKVHVPVGWSPIAPFANRSRANAIACWLELAKYRFTGSACRQFVFRVGAWKGRPRRYSALLAGSHRPRTEAEPRSAALEHRH